MIAPVLDGLDPYWQAASEGKLAVGRCRSCGKAYFYPRPLCPLCGSASTELKVASGRGRIYSFSIVRNAKRSTAAAIVELEEGPRVPTALLDCDVFDLKIGDPVEVFFQQADGTAALTFTTEAAQAARRYARAALGESSIVPGLPSDEATPEVQRAAVIGAGTMGSGISIALLQAGISVLLIDANAGALEKASAQIAKVFQTSVSRGRMTREQVSGCMAALRCETQISAVGAADLVIEAVYEQMALKKRIFGELDRYCAPGATLATNTSTLNVDEIAGSTKRPGDVIGLHFFSPAHVMKLLEVVRGPRTGGRTIMRAMALGKRLGKVPVLVGICDGFVGNRLMIARERQAGELLLHGALPDQIDRVLREFGLPMGTFELQDMAGGIELNYRFRLATGGRDFIIDRLFELGRLGQKTGKGYYSYDPSSRAPRLDQEGIEVFKAASRHHGIERRTFSDAQLRDRLILPMINEAAKLIEEGVVIRPSDIDVVWQNGYGWPTWRGGPVYWADRVGPAFIYDRLGALHNECGEAFRPAGLLKRLASSGGHLLDHRPGT
ncbi:MULTISPECIES: 3-hydroxyacyl-CoA dehydrogenase NAD-binding domain-containing protein [unclassified Bradyrhizobium]|uniref:3-hydroxyacyl-CoA dehydrogenase NAD-binding domain-containing protein n=1 Tax=unclassified Bradyrhizobium TaxID=2631580 RepID=UPI0024469FFB|nr:MULTISPECIES: 3-hydroxyacyl-CoA dehydrogenase NAD-binding domain-containing protein [unclassified Bradyrhizobium]MDH2346217.1 3-hydroxyacyl-CoA dehydrogenase NAD-binding domain-containing protein [Bradyrhizobium sp. SSUT77]MDH2350410.1 3-hydroxyacyl-CoA dehydrogenase NAD-binding domain-containing protein [Bradyrhizobium sp. SSUT112]